MKSPSFRSVLFLLVIVHLAACAFADAPVVGIFTNRNAWQSNAANIGGITNIGFEGIAPTGGLVNFTSTGLTLSGAHFDSFSQTGDKYLNVVDSNYPNYSCIHPCYQWNSGAVLHGPPTTFGSDFGFPAGIMVTLPTNTYAVATDLWTILPDGQKIYVQVYGPGWGTGTYIFGGINPTRSFIGFTSDHAITGFKVFAASVANPGAQGGPYTDLDNFSFAQVPEPGSLMLVATGISMAARFRRKGLRR